MSERGIVKFYDPDKNFGFITPEKPDSKDVYFNQSSLPRNREYDPVQGDAVTYEPRPSAKGVMAVRVQLTT